MDQELPTLLEQMSSPLFSVRFVLSNLKFSAFCFCRPLSFWTFSFDYCIVCSLIYVFWLPLWYLLVIVLSVLWFTSSDYPFGIFWSLYCLFFDLSLLVTPLVSFGHCIVCSLIYVFWLPLEKHTLQEVQDNPYLRLQISNDLKWSIHINNVCKKANATLGFLRRNLRNVPEACRKTTYVTLVRLIMEYGATIWNPYLKRDIDKLERIQNRAIRFVRKDYKSRETGAITRMREDLELETLEERRLSLRLIIMYKVVEGLVPVSYSSFSP